VKHYLVQDTDSVVLQATICACVQVMPASQAQAQQRAGRAGREAPGKCFRLYTEATYATLAPEATPELLRSNLAAAVLQLKALGVQDVAAFDFLDRPPEPALKGALKLLQALRAVVCFDDLCMFCAPHG
jgi:ATP-dependent RNA helicase DHX8/PRP22